MAASYTDYARLGRWCWLATVVGLLAVAVVRANHVYKVVGTATSSFTPADRNAAGRSGSARPLGRH
jgi:hypothetical protein